MAEATDDLATIRERAAAHQRDLERARAPKRKRVSQYLGPADAAAYLGIPVRQLRRYVPPSAVFGVRTPRWSVEDLDSLSSATGVCQVYAIRRADTREIKIGISNNPLRRLRALQGAHGERLELLASSPGDVMDEAALHAQFAAHRKLGEWFHETPEIMAWVEEVRRNA